MHNKVRVRFAPSPTGPLHIGGARSVLFNYLFARGQNGTLVLRIEDTDLERSSRESEENIKASLRWLGLNWDEGIDVGGPYEPYRQTERLDVYEKYVNQLLASGHAYKCYCTEEELEEQREVCRQKGELPRYLNRCRKLTEKEQGELAKNRKSVVRFRVPAGEVIRIDDRVRGIVTFESDGIGDFIIVKSDGIPTYNFAVVIDDATMEITHVIRGEEHLTNTPRQILIYKALGLPEPSFAHVSLILGKDKSKMSKRHGDTSVEQYIKKGYLPEALINFLALMGWAPEGEEEIFTMEQLIEKFSLDRVSKSPAVFDMEKLNYINGYYIRNSSIELLTKMAIPYLQEAGYVPAQVDAEYEKWLQGVVGVARNYVSYMAEIPEYVDVFFNDEFKMEDDKALEALKGEQVPDVLRVLQEKVEKRALHPEEVKDILKEICTDLNLGGKKVFMPIRAALTGKTKGPEMHDLIPLLGPERIAKRINNSLSQI
ncbi:glutamate--tRNA ligase [Desulfitibacter alkalitolerans]|uniref:glutamate--tRNA ligase n=1 Tax=Desulfitibacter alkalitolerans TaxID=264641 RepID=UPI000552FD92|nr:glutamate--tRNA ligase [Desulfitibacter alkalitolerans]